MEILWTCQLCATVASAPRPLCPATLPQVEWECERHASLASVVQRYGHM